MQIISTLAPLLLASLALSTPTPHAERDEPLSRAPINTEAPVNIREIFADFVHIFYDEGNYTLAMTKYLAPNMIQHNPTIANGRDAQIAAVRVITQGYVPSVQVVMVDKHGIGPAASNGSSAASPDTAGFAMTYTRWASEPGKDLPLSGVADIYRIGCNGLFVEHWDAIEALPKNATNPDPF